MFNYQYLNFCSFILVTIFISSSIASPFCDDLTSTDDKDTPCFTETPIRNPILLRSSGNSLVLPCHVAHSKLASIEWWYEDFQKTVNMKIYPIYPPVRPTVLRFITTNIQTSKHANETDIMDVSVLLRHVNVDDSGIYRCVIRSWLSSRTNNHENNDSDESSSLASLSYHVALTGPRLCQASLGTLPCFTNMRTSSPTIVDGYQTAFLQCVIHSYNRPATVFWVVGNASANSVLITDYLTTNQHNGDRLRRIFPLSPFDYSIELTLNRDTRERTYSCVIDGANDVETTLFTYIVRSIELENVADKTVKLSQNQTILINGTETHKPVVKVEKLVPHDALTSEEVDELHNKKDQEQKKTQKNKKLDENKKIVEKNEDDENDEDGDDLLDFFTREESSKKDK